MTTSSIGGSRVTSVNWIHLLIFFYFFTTSADLLSVEVSLFHCKVNHALSLVLFILISFGKKTWVMPDKKFAIAFLATIAAMGLSGIFGAYPYRSLVYLSVYIFTFAVYFLLPLNLFLFYGKETILRLYFVAFVSTGILAAFQFLLSFSGIIVPFVTQFIQGGIARGQAMSYEPSYYALYLVPYVMYCNARFLFDTQKIARKWLLLFGKNLLLLLSTSTGAFFAYFIFFFVTPFIAGLQWVRECERKIFRKIVKIMGLFAAFFCGLALLMPHLFISSFWKFFAIGFMAHGSFTQRWEGLIHTWRIFLDHPLLGVGVGGVGPVLYRETFAQGESVPIHEAKASIFELFDPTNVSTELLASLGVVGGIAFGSLIFLYFRYLQQTAKLPKLTMEEKSTLFGFLVSVIVMLSVWQFNQNIFRSYVWVHLAICMGYCMSLRSSHDRR